MASLNIETFLGPCVVIIWLSLILYGLFLAQVYFYLTTYRDHIVIKSLVIILCALETSHVGICIHIMYGYLVIDFANPEKVLTVIWSVGVAVCLELVISVIVQSYYIYRIWRLSKNLSVSLYVIVVLVVRVAIGFRAISFTFGNKTWEAMSAIALFQSLVNTSLSLSALVDSSIALILAFYLHRSHTLARARSTKNTVHKLMYYGLSAGAVSMIMSIITVIIFNTFRTELHYIGFLMVLAKVYANSMLAMLNVRQGIKRDAASDNGLSIELSALPSEHQTENKSLGESTKIRVDHETVTTSDYWVDAAETTSNKARGGFGIPSLRALQLA